MCLTSSQEWRMRRKIDVEVERWWIKNGLYRAMGKAYEQVCPVSSREYGYRK